mgnify:FL=1
MMSNVVLGIIDFFFWGASWAVLTTMLALGVVGAAFSRKQKLGFAFLGILIFYSVAKLGLDYAMFGEMFGAERHFIYFQERKPF